MLMNSKHSFENESIAHAQVFIMCLDGQAVIQVLKEGCCN